MALPVKNKKKRTAPYETDRTIIDNKMFNETPFVEYRLEFYGASTTVC
jgi:hypothetical protein